jgi:putative zinc finger protein
MNCPTDEVLRAYFDAELDPLEISQLKNHLQACPACEARFQALSASALRVGSKLASLDSPPFATEANPQIAFARFRASLPVSEEHVPFFARILGRRWRFAWAASFAVGVLAISLMFPATRSFAQRLLATLRVERVQTVSLDFSAMNTGTSSQPLEMLAKMLSDNAVVTTNEKPTTVDSQAAASQAAGFPVRVLSGRADEATFDVTGAHAFHLTLDRSRLQDVLDQAGRPDLVLPATLDGATVSVQVPRAVALAYGNCKKGDASSTAAAPSAAPNPCLMVMQAPSPVINVPSDLNIQQLAEIGLQLAGWSPVKAREFCQTVDWKSTLVLPIPRTVQSYETVSINGVRGTLMHFPESNNAKRPSFALVWVDGGIIYSIIGNADPSSAVQLASALQ